MCLNLNNPINNTKSKSYRMFIKRPKKSSKDNLHANNWHTRFKISKYRKKAKLCKISKYRKKAKLCKISKYRKKAKLCSK